MHKDFSELIEYLGNKFQIIDERFKKIEGQIAKLPTKAYLDDKLADFKVRNKFA